MDSALATPPQLAQRNEQRFDRYRTFDLKPRHGDAALVELHSRGAFSAAQLSRAIQEWDNLARPEHGEDRHTLWRLFNASTEALKPTGERVNHDLLRQRSELVSALKLFWKKRRDRFGGPVCGQVEIREIVGHP